jgi:hypothetical protein
MDDPQLTPEERQAFDEVLAEELGEARKSIDADEAMRISVKNTYIMEQIAARAREKGFAPEKKAFYWPIADANALEYLREGLRRAGLPG